MINVEQRLRYWVIIFLLLCTGFMKDAIAREIGDSVLSAGDAIKIFIYGHPDMTTEGKVSETGNITFPLLGEVAVEGLTPSETERKIADLLESRDILRKPNVVVISVSRQSQMISVLGYVRNQGRFPIEGKRNLTEVLAAAGGIVQDGGDVVTVIRSIGNSFEKKEVDILEMVRAGDRSSDINIQSDDLIYVERAPRFYIYGEVQRAGTYKLERNMTVIQALSTAGGLNLRGTERGIRIQRRDSSGSYQLFTVKSNDLVQPDDVIYIKESLF